MNTFLYFYINFLSFLLGICVGSFINVLAYRIPIEMSFVKGRSVCPKCGAQIKSYDLIPLVSYIILKGKCRNCHSKISVRYLLVELISGLLTLAIFTTLGFSMQALLAFFLSMILLTIALIDIDTMTIPNGLVISLIPLAVLCLFYSDITVVSRIIGFICVSLPMLGIACLIPDGFGGGDIKLIAVCGFILGWKNTLLATFIALLIGGCYAAYLLLSKKRELGSHIAFGPYLCIGIFTAFVWGDRLISWYLNLLM